MDFIAHEYQRYAIERIMNIPKSALFLDMGLGKTVITLTAFNEIKFDMLDADKCLVIAPKKVAESVWEQEAAKWKHLQHLTFSRILGTEKQRTEALKKNADVYIVNRENVEWLSENCKKWFFDMVIIDELSSFKNSKSKRFKALKKRLSEIDRIVGLTGTPASNGLEDLWGQIYLLDKGERLGRTLTVYREKYFRQIRLGAVATVYQPKPDSLDEVQAKISDICISMKAADYLKLPDRIDNIIPVELSEKEMQLYKKLEKSMVLETEGVEIVAFSAAALINKLLQLSSGSVYDSEKRVIKIHNEKIEALKECVAAIHQTGESVLIFIKFRYEYEELRKALKGYRIMGTDRDDTADIVREWNAHRLDCLIAHPASAAYGLNLQEGGRNIIWYSLTWSLEEYQQTNARLHRQGQSNKVFIHHILVNGTAEKRVFDVLQKKDMNQEAFLKELKADILK